MEFELDDQVQLVKLDATEDDTALYANRLRHYFLKTGQVMAISSILDRYLVMFEKEPHSPCENASIKIWVPGEWLRHVCAPEKFKQFTGKVICVSDDVDTMQKKPWVPTHFTPGKVYSIEQGVLFDDLVNDRLETPFTAGIRNIDELNKKMEQIYPTRNLKFIEFKGFTNE